MQDPRLHGDDETTSCHICDYRRFADRLYLLPHRLSQTKLMQIIFRQLGQCAYEPIWQAMQTFTGVRDKYSLDEIWLVEHPPVFTQGQAGKAEHILNPGNIPVIHTDRGGQVTYHGPGQLLAYLLLDIKRRKIGIRQLVSTIEQSIINLLAKYNIVATSQRNAPGVYVGAAKICSIGLRIRRGCSYHGLALNVHCDLEPFTQINPCGYAKLPIINMHDLIPAITLSNLTQQLIPHLSHHLGYTTWHTVNCLKFILK